MAYTASTDTGTQRIAHKYSDPLTALKLSELGRHVRAPGIYAGGILGYSGRDVYLSPCKFEIADNTNALDQISAETTTEITLTASAIEGTYYVLLRWARTDSETSNYVQVFLASSAEAGDLVVGSVYVNGAGAINALSYASRTQAALPQIALQVVPNNNSHVSSMIVYVQSGNVSASGSSAASLFQPITITANTTAYTRFDLIYVDGAGAVQKAIGTAAVSPALPAVSGTPLAKVVVAAGATSITAPGVGATSYIVDMRASLGSSLSVIAWANDLVGASVGKNGTLSLGGGMGVMWGRGGVLTAEGTATVNLTAGGKAFSAVHRVFLTSYIPGATTDNNTFVQLLSFTAASFVWRRQNAAGSGGSLYPDWLAIGVTDGTW